MTYQADNKRPSFLDSISSLAAKIGIVVALITSLVGAVYTSLQFLDVIPRTPDKTVRPPPPPAAAPSPPAAAPSPCRVVVNDLKAPMEVSVGHWNNNDNIDLSVPYENPCPEPVTAIVRFRLSSTSIGLQIAPTRCEDKNREECWEQKTLIPGQKSDWQLSKPPLTKLRNPLVPPVKIELQWEIKDNENQRTIRTDTARISVKN